MNRIAKTYFTSTFLIGAQAYNLEANLAQVNAEFGLGSINVGAMTEDGVITIPLTKLTQVKSNIATLTYTDIESANGLEVGESGMILADKGRMKVRVNLNNYQNTSYMGDLYFGNPPQKIRAIFDTGSANPWVISKNARAKNSFDTSKSSTFVEPAKKEWTNISFGSGTLRGYFATDEVVLGDVDDKATSLSIPNWTFGVV